MDSDAAIKELLSAMTEARGILDRAIKAYAKELTKPLVEKPKDEDFARVKQMFLDYYIKEKGTPYYFEAKDAVAVKSICRKLKFILQDGMVVEDSFSLVLQRLKRADQWVYDNLSLSILNSKFDVVIAKIKAGGDEAKYQSMHKDILERLNKMK